MLIIGIDTGLTGAIAALDKNGGFIGVRDMPVLQLSDTWKFIDGMALLQVLTDLRTAWGCAGDARVYVEATSARPDMHANSCHSMGRTLGGVISVVHIKGWPLELVAPSSWKAKLKVPKGDKGGLHMARNAFPDAELRLEKHANRGDALMIAEWGRRQALQQGLFA